MDTHLTLSHSNSLEDSTLLCSPLRVLCVCVLHVRIQPSRPASPLSAYINPPIDVVRYLYILHSHFSSLKLHIKYCCNVVQAPPLALDACVNPTYRCFSCAWWEGPCWRSRARAETRRSTAAPIHRPRTPGACGGGDRRSKRGKLLLVASMLAPARAPLLHHGLLTTSRRPPCAIVTIHGPQLRRRCFCRLVTGWSTAEPWCCGCSNTSKQGRCELCRFNVAGRGVNLHPRTIFCFYYLFIFHCSL